MQIKKNLKNKPIKKIPETDEIFKNVHNINKKSDENPNSLRISIDAKAKVNVGNLDRGGKDRRQKPLITDDHDMNIETKLIPFGITEVCSGTVSFYYGKSKETSDFVVDCLNRWLIENISKHKNITELVINLDNGPDQRSNRTQFIKRIVELSIKFNIHIHLAYYPPYHSKYNYIEHIFGVLEKFWNGAILNTINTVLEWTRNMKWKNKKPLIVELINKNYEKGITLSKKEMVPFLKYVTKSEKLPKWDLIISPKIVV